MAELVKCSLCGRDVSSECRACPGCGHNVANELYQKKEEEERVQKENWKKKGLCEKCGNSVFQKKHVKEDYAGGGIWERVYAECIKCGWYDWSNNYEETCIKTFPGGDSGVYIGKHRIEGYGLKKFGKRKIEDPFSDYLMKRHS